jgi:hypothetical protein
MQNVSGRNILRGATLIAAGIIIAATAAAQETRIAISIGGSYDATMTDVVLRFPPCFGEDMDGRGSLSGYSAYVEGRLTPLAGIKQLGLSARLRWQQLEGEARSDPRQEFGMVSNYPYPIAHTTREYHVFTTESAYLDILAEYHLPWSFLIRGGPSIGYRWFSRMIILQEYIEPENVRPANESGLPSTMDGTTLICYNHDSWPGGNGMALGLIAQLGMTIRTTDRIALIPEIGLRRELLQPADDKAWPILELSAGLLILYTFGDEP